MTPLVQIVHLTDPHFVEVGSRTALHRAQLLRVADFLDRVLWPGFGQMMRDGLAPHDESAKHALREFIDDITTKDPTWSQCDNWLVVSGDLTTYGDNGSLSDAIGYIRQIATCFTGQLILYGNHDAWESKFPAVSSLASFRASSNRLQGKGFSVQAASGRLVTRRIGSAPIVQLVALDTVSLDFVDNTFAVGRADPGQVQEIADLLTDEASLRILVTHHPIHYPNRPTFGMALRNDSQIARLLVSYNKRNERPLVHLVLSGHTHSLFPGRGQLPPSPRSCAHDDLGDDQAQLICGSAMQIDVARARGDLAQHVQVLRVYYDQTRPGKVTLERLVGARQQPAAGRFVFVPAGASGGYAEEMDVPI